MFKSVLINLQSAICNLQFKKSAICNFRLLGVTLGLCLYLILGNANLALASIHTYPESATQTMYRSVQSFRDESNRAWQVVLYKRVKLGQIKSVNLRLVGFPGVVELAHPKELQITTGTGEVWQAKDVFDELSLPNNVGEYDLLEVMKDLDYDTPLQLNLPLKNEQIVSLIIPPFAVGEWRRLVVQEG